MSATKQAERLRILFRIAVYYAVRVINSANAHDDVAPRGIPYLLAEFGAIQAAIVELREVWGLHDLDLDAEVA